MNPDLIAAALAFATFCLYAPGAWREWRSVESARDTRSMERHHQATEALRR